MEQTANLCAQVPASLLARIREEQEKAGMPRGEYITQILTNYYEKKKQRKTKQLQQILYIPNTGAVSGPASKSSSSSGVYGKVSISQRAPSVSSFS